MNTLAIDGAIATRHQMDLFEPIAGAVGELSACVLGRVVGRTFNLDGRKAQRIGEHVILAVVLGTAVILTVMFS